MSRVELREELGNYVLLTMGSGDTYSLSHKDWFAIRAMMEAYKTTGIDQFHEMETEAGAPICFYTSSIEVILFSTPEAREANRHLAKLSEKESDKKEWEG